MLEPRLNQTIIMPVAESNTAIGIASNLFLIESINTTEARIQSVSTADGNEHTIEKIAIESLVGTRITEGQLALVTVAAFEEEEALIPLVIMELKKGII